LFVVNSLSGTIGQYTTAGAVVDASLVTGLSFPAGLVIGAPEPSTAAMLMIGTPIFLAGVISKRRAISADGMAKSETKARR
jgi:hypothetical protein